MHRRVMPTSALVLLSCFILAGCASTSTPGTVASPSPNATLAAYPLTGDTSPVRDPSLMHQGSMYYLFSTDPGQPDLPGYLPIRCSPDKTSWIACGYVFDELPPWIAKAVPGVANLWAPDISYFNNTYHLYYAASTLHSQVSAIGLATNATLDRSSPLYQWVDQGEVLSSSLGDNFNAIDPNIFIHADGTVWMNYGSYWTGIKQRSIDAVTGMLSSADTTIYSLASRPQLDHAIEGASLVQHGSFYYLFVSIGHCCELDYTKNDYEEAVGRSSSPHGPFLDTAGVDLEAGGGTVLLQGNETWIAPGGGTAYLDASTGDSLIVFHALKAGPNTTGYLWLKPLAWPNDWPSLN